MDLLVFKLLMETFKYGGVVQLGERFACTEEVVGSNPITSTRVDGGVVTRWIANPLFVGSNPTRLSRSEDTQRTRLMLGKQSYWVASG